MLAISSSRNARAIRLIALVFGLSVCIASCSVAPAKNDQAADSPQGGRSETLSNDVTKPSSIRQTDAHGRPLPFRTTFPNRWSELNDGTTYEPCTALTSEALTALGVNPRSATDVAMANYQTARGCTWEFTDSRTSTVSQIVGKKTDLLSYKASNSGIINWFPDSEIAQRTVLVGTLKRQNNCTASVSSGSSVVTTSVTATNTPTAQLCEIATSFVRSTIDKMPP